jgi:hypothetical protein
MEPELAIADEAAAEPIAVVCRYEAGCIKGGPMQST